MAVETLARCAYYNGDDIYIGEALGDAPKELEIAAQGIHDVLMSSWQKFVGSGHLSAAGLIKKIRQPYTQAEIMAEKGRNARYFMAFKGEYDDPAEAIKLTDPEQIQGFVRIESYSPRNPLKKSYPNISDLEFRSGKLAEAPADRYARVLLDYSLRHYPYDRQVAAYTEEPNESGRHFFADHGFVERRITAVEQIDESSQIAYVHMEAPNQRAIFQTFPPQEHAFTYY